MNILIIDDEPLILNTVYGQLKRAELKLDLVDMAGSAQEARRKLERNYYHIFLCDIVMPGEDGIAFARWVLSRYPHCKFIFLTAHADFEYMKEAISLQSFDYILQPAGREELEHVVRRALMQISIEQKNRELMDTGSFFVDREIDILDGNAMRYLTGLTGDASFLRRLIRMKLGDWDEEVLYLPFLVHVLNMNSSWKEEDRGLLRSTYYNIIDEIMLPFQTRNVVVLRNEGVGSFIALIMFGGGSVRNQDRLLEQIENMHVFFQKLMKMETIIYYGDFCGFEQLYDMCGRLLAEQKNNVRNVSRIQRVGESGIFGGGSMPEARLSSWKTLLNQDRLMDLKSSIVRYLDYYSNSSDANRDTLMKLHQGISEMLLGRMASMDINSADVFDEKLTYYDFMYCWREINEMKTAIEYVINRLYDLSDLSGQDVIRRTIRYIRQNIDSDILVSELAERVGMNPEYLTRIFKKSTGYSLKKYIDNEKMEVAKVLLSTTNLPVTIVSERAGYANYSNFMRSFKQIVGCTPTEFREKN